MKKKEYKKPEMQVVNITSCTLLQHLLWGKEAMAMINQIWKAAIIGVSNSHYNA